MCRGAFKSSLGQGQPGHGYAYLASCSVLPPTIAEIAEYLDASVDEVLEAMESSSAYSSVSLEAPSGMDDDDTPSVIDRYATEDQELAFTDDRIIIEEALAELLARVSARSLRCASCRG